GDVELGKLGLVDAVTGATVASQWTDAVYDPHTGHLREVTLTMGTDLPTGGERTYRLVENAHPAAAGAAPVVVTERATDIVLDNGKVQVALPVSQSPGMPPVLRMGYLGDWLATAEWANPV